MTNVALNESRRLQKKALTIAMKNVYAPQNCPKTRKKGNCHKCERLNKCDKLFVLNFPTERARALIEANLSLKKKGDKPETAPAPDAPVEALPAPVESPAPAPEAPATPPASPEPIPAPAPAPEAPVEALPAPAPAPEPVKAPEAPAPEQAKPVRVVSPLKILIRG